MPGHYENLSGQPSLVNANSRGLIDVNRDGVQVLKYRGNNIMRSDLLTDNAENLAGFVTNKTGILLGIGIEDDVDDVEQEGYYSTIIYTKTGVPIRFTRTGDTNSKKIHFKWTLTKGLLVGQANGIVRLLTA